LPFLPVIPLSPLRVMDGVMSLVGGTINGSSRSL
jgi:hypothetical protein